MITKLMQTIVAEDLVRLYSYLAVMVGTDVADSQQAWGASGATETTYTRHHPSSTSTTLCALPELSHGLESNRIGQQQCPEQLGAATALVQVNLDSLFLLLAHLRATQTFLNKPLTVHLKSQFVTNFFAFDLFRL